MLQHRGKAYWKIITSNKSISGYGSLPSDRQLTLLAHSRKLTDGLGIGYLSKRSPQFKSMNRVNVVLDGFLVDLEKLHLHPLVGTSRESDSLFKVSTIFTKLLFERYQPERSIEFLDRHLRGNLVLVLGDSVYAFRNSTGFKPLVLASDRNKMLTIVASENSLRNLVDLEFKDVRAGSLIALHEGAVKELSSDLRPRHMLMDPFEFIRESHVTSLFKNKSIYEIRKEIGKKQADFLSSRIKHSIDGAYAEPDYTRPMALGYSIMIGMIRKNFDMAEGVIKDRYDDADHMIDFSEQVSKNKLLTTHKSLKFIVEDQVRNRRIASIQGTIQTGGTAKETIYYLRKAGAKSVDLVVSYVPTADGRQVGLYTKNRELVANKYVGKVSSIDELNVRVKKELGADNIYYNSPEILARGIGVPEYDLWFPEWVRFLDYK